MKIIINCSPTVKWSLSLSAGRIQLVIHLWLHGDVHHCVARRPPSLPCDAPPPSSPQCRGNDQRGHPTTCSLLEVTEDTQSVQDYIYFIVFYFIRFYLNNLLTFLSVPESVRASLPSLKHRGKRSSKGKGRRSEESTTDKPPLPPSGQDVTTVTPTVTLTSWIRVQKLHYINIVSPL